MTEPRKPGRPAVSNLGSYLDASTLVRRIGWVPVLCLLGVLILTSVAGLTWNTSTEYGRAGATPVTAQSRDIGTVPPPSGSTGAVYPNTASSPNRIVIPKLQASAPIVRVATDANRELQIPEKPTIVGWWTPGAKPGAKVGTAVLAGHINYAGVTGTLASIGQLKPGDEIDVYGRTGSTDTRVRFAVTGVRNYAKTSLPYQEIFNQNTAGRLAVITCGGAFDTSTGNYLENIVVYAVPVSSSTV